MALDLDPYSLERYMYFHETTGIYDDLGGEVIGDIRRLPLEGVIRRSSNDLLDLLSQRIYGDERLWFVLAYYNDIIDPLDYTVSNIEYPSKADVEELFLDSRDVLNV